MRSVLLTFSQDLSQAQGISVHDNILQLLLELPADTQASHCRRTVQEFRQLPPAPFSPPAPSRGIKVYFLHVSSTALRQ